MCTDDGKSYRLRVYLLGNAIRSARSQSRKLRSPDKVNATVGRLNAMQCNDVHLICPIAFNLCQKSVDLKPVAFGLTYFV